MITGPEFCLNRSFGGPATYPHDSDGDGVADVCSLPRTRRAAAARQNALERLGDNQPERLQMLFPEECSKVPATFGETKAETTDECATGRLLTRFDQLTNQLESLTIKQMNKIRSAAPTLPTLEADDNLSAVAQAHAQAMADAQSLPNPVRLLRAPRARLGLLEHRQIGEHHREPLQPASSR